LPPPTRRAVRFADAEAIADALKAAAHFHKRETQVDSSFHILGYPYSPCAAEPMHVSFSALIPGLFKSARVSRIEFAKPCVHRSGHSAMALLTQPFGKCGMGWIRQENGGTGELPGF